MGFGPQLVDFDGDGDEDMLSGNWVKQIILFRREADGSFAAGEPVKDADGKPIELEYGMVVFAVDWDTDGDRDLIAGTVTGTVWLLRNTGTLAEPIYGKREALTVAGEKIRVPGGDAGPAVADWDGDGRLDLLVGTGVGSVLWYRNIGTPQTPELADPETLIPEPEPGSQRGTRAKICVTDWNEDGRLDIVLGDFGDTFEKEPSPEEQQWRKEYQAKQAELFTRWSSLFHEYRALQRSEEPEESRAKRDRDKQLTDLRRELQQISKERDIYHSKEQSLKPGRQYHGRVWLFLRKQAADAS